MFDMLKESVADAVREVESAKRSLDEAVRLHTAVSEVLDLAESGTLDLGRGDSKIASVILNEMLSPSYRLQGDPLTNPIAVNTLIFGLTRSYEARSYEARRAPDICVHVDLHEASKEYRMDFTIRVALCSLAKRGKIRLSKKRNEFHGKNPVWHVALTEKTAAKLVSAQAEEEAAA